MPVSLIYMSLSFIRTFSSLADISSVVAQAMATYKTVTDKQDQVSHLESVEEEKSTRYESSKQSNLNENPPQ
jgi:hypothetical protein